MKKFNKPFDEYELAPERPMTVELSSQLGHHLHLVDNPIYYLHAFQYMKGSFYRAVFGYESFWDSGFEEKLLKHLDYRLNFHARRREYYIEEISFNHRLKIRGLKWLRGVKPAQLSFKVQWPKWIKAAEKATARINLLDKPHHVDIQFSDGEIFSVSFMQYLYWKRKAIRSLDHAHAQQPKSKSDREYTPNAECREANEVESPGSHFPIKTPHTAVLSMRERIRRSSALSKTYPQARRYLV